MPGLVIQTIDPDQFAKKEEIPTAGDATPEPVKSSGRMGLLSKRFARADHTHATSVQKAKIILATAGEQTWMFPNGPYDDRPVVLLTPEEDGDGLPVVAKVKRYIMDAAGKFAGVVVKGYRLQQTPASVTNPVALANWSPAGGATPVGITVNCYAAAPTVPPVT